MSGDWSHISCRIFMMFSHVWRLAVTLFIITPHWFTATWREDFITARLNLDKESPSIWLCVFSPALVNPPVLPFFKCEANRRWLMCSSSHGRLFLGSLFCHLPPSAGVPHSAPWDRRIGQAQLMTRPSYQLMMGEDGKLVPVSASFSQTPLLSLLFPLQLHIVDRVLLGVSLPAINPLHPLGISQLTYSRWKGTKQRDEQRQ